MFLNEEFKNKHIKKWVWILLLLMITLVIYNIVLFFKHSKLIWNFPGLSIMAKYQIAQDGIIEKYSHIYVIDKGEKFIIITSQLLFEGECHSIYDNEGNLITNITFYEKSGQIVKILPLGKRETPSAWLIKSTDNNDLVIWRNSSSKFEVMSVVLFNEIFYGIE